MKLAKPWFPAVAGLAAVLLFNALFTPGFFQISMQEGHFYGSLVDILNRAAPTCLVAVGMTLVIATGGVDLSVGSLMAVAGAIAANLVAGTWGTGPDWPLASVIAVALAASALLGALNAFLVGALKVQPIVATLLMMVAGRGAAQLVNNGQIVTFHHPGLSGLARSAVLGLPVPVWLAIATLTAVALIVNATSLGLFIRATGDNPSAARHTGISVGWVKAACYVLVAVCAGLAGLVATGDINGADANNTGLYMELDAILAVSVGGTLLTGGRFTLAGTFAGCLFMQAITSTILVRGVPPEATLIVKAVAVVLVCLLQSPTFRGRLARFTGARA